MKDLVIEKLVALGADVSYKVSDDEIDVVVKDFDGFDDDYCEIYRDYDEDAVESFEEWLEEHCVSCQLDFYQVYKFDGFSVSVGYESYDV